MILVIDNYDSFTYNLVHYLNELGAETQIAEWCDGGVRLFTVAPEAVGLRRSGLTELQGGDPAHNAQALRNLLQGQAGACRDVAALSAAAAMDVAEKLETLREGIDTACSASRIVQGHPNSRLDELLPWAYVPPISAVA